ncbi:beta-1,3-galactosyltransferase pvg3-like [Phragmites australis]|uniref:beta-1,3-galactosyltransferase pvg3-like n=1 Tax=Phragmites australis TaxID=29695 RepID=UPI002D76E0F8|nr:beta-1,3-galactosyltransferase pvg3-like [Phragmites australis]
MKLPSFPSSPNSFARVLPSPSIPLFLLPVLLVAVIYLVVFPNDFKIQEVMFGSSCSNSGTLASAKLAGGYTAEPPVGLRVLLGVLTRPDTYERRALLRLAYSLQPPPVGAVVDVRFVFCNLDKEEDRVLVALEIIAYGDIVVLNCTENMDGGKTYEYFSTIPRLFAEEPYDYVGKTDDDTYYRLAALADTLRTKARRDMYHGYLSPCHWMPEKQYMSGMGYIVSWDIAEWISATEELRNDHDGPEDRVFGGWLRKGGRYKNVYNEEPRMYDYWDREMPDEVICFRHELMADTVAVHKLKDRLRWARTLKFFNATQGLKPSKMYHVDLHSNMYDHVGL